MATKAIPVTAAKVTATLSDFPVVIQPSVMTGWGSLTLAEAQSIRFYSDSGLTTELAREVVSADEIHVKIPSLTTSTTIYADYDGIRSDYATTATYGAEAVWSDYKAVWHLQEAVNTTTGGYKDSTSNNNDITGYSMSISEGAGAFGGNGQNFDGASDYLRITGFSLPVDAASSVSAWAKHTGTPSGSDGYIFESDNSSNDGFIHSTRFDTSGTFDFYSFTFNRAVIAVANKSGFTASQWNYVVSTVNPPSGALEGYINGVSKGTDSFSSRNARNNDEFNIGSDRNQGRKWTGAIDEVRVRESLLSANWITTEYNNQSDVASFWGTVTDAGGGTDTLGIKLGSTTINKVMLGSTEIKKVYLGSTTIYENL